MYKAITFLILLQIFFLTVLLPSPKKKIEVSSQVLTLIKESNDSLGRAAGALILLKESTITVDKTNQPTQVFHIVGKILDPKARVDFSQIPFIFDSYYEDVNVDFARTIHPDGSTLELFSDAVNIEPIPHMPGSIQYSDTKLLMFSLPGLDVGTAFEYQITIKRKRPVIEGEWFFSHSFNYILRNVSLQFAVRFDPVVRSIFVVRVPRGKKFQFSISKDSIPPVRTTSAAYDEYRWEYRNIPEVKVESGMPHLDDVTLGVNISTLTSWKQMDQWVGKKLNVNRPVPKILRAKAIEITAGAHTDFEKIGSLFHYIQREIKYVAADLARGGYVPHPPEDVLNNRYGDCKDQTMLFIAFLKAVGIEAYPALLNPQPYSESTEIPWPMFSHVIVYLPNGGNPLWLDTTPGVTPFPEPYVANQDVMAFVVDGNGGKLIKTPKSSADDNRCDFSFSVSRDETSARMKVDFSCKGALSDGMKQDFTSFSKDDVFKTFQSIIVSQYTQAVVDSVAVSDFRDPEIRFRSSVYFHIDSMWTGKINRFIYGGNAKLALQFFLNGAEYPLPDSRRYNLKLAYPFSIYGVELYTRPNTDLSNSSVPKGDEFDSKYIRCRRGFTETFSGISAQWSIASERTEVPLDEYAKFYSDIGRMKSMLNWNVIFYASLKRAITR